MIQDLSFGRLENEYHNIAPSDSDIAYCFKNGSILILKNSDGSYSLPHISEMKIMSENSDLKIQYAFRLQNENCFLVSGNFPENVALPYYYEPVRSLRETVSKDLYFGVVTAWHLYHWYESNRFCGHCGAPTEHDVIERMLKCPVCKNMIYPKINPAVIIAVTNGNSILLSKYAGRNYNRFALLAGYTEIGETLEQTVSREVMEEVGLKVKNIRYYKSQPWGIDGNILMGFFCDLDGADAVRLDENELSYAGWYERDEIPCSDDGISLTREMIRVFKESYGV